jgi:hypothetical protein
MGPIDGVAVCPTCGRTDTAAALQPLFVVTGASGSGKTTIFGPLARLLVSRCATFDVDWLLDAAGALSDARTVTEIPWEGFFQAWLSAANELRTVHPGGFVTSMNKLLSDTGSGRTSRTRLTPRSVPQTKRPRWSPTGSSPDSPDNDTVQAPPECLRTPSRIQALGQRTRWGSLVQPAVGGPRAGMTWETTSSRDSHPAAGSMPAIRGCNMAEPFLRTSFAHASGVTTA